MPDGTNEITPFMALKHYPGSYECHVTIHSEDEQTVQRFEEFCTRYELKPLVIKLDSGATPDQPMLSKVYHGSPEIVWEEIKTVLTNLKIEEFDIERLKIEAGFNNKNIPESETEVSALNDMNYFEFHIKVEIPAGMDLSPLRAEVKPFGGHLSLNSLWKNEQTQFFFVTQRIKECGREEAEQQLSSLQSFLEGKGITIVKTVREFNIYDSNIDLDSGWM